MRSQGASDVVYYEGYDSPLEALYIPSLDHTDINHSILTHKQIFFMMTVKHHQQLLTNLNLSIISTWVNATKIMKTKTLCKTL